MHTIKTALGERRLRQDELAQLAQSKEAERALRDFERVDSTPSGTTNFPSGAGKYVLSITHGWIRIA